MGMSTPHPVAPRDGFDAAAGDTACRRGRDSTQRHNPASDAQSTAAGLRTSRTQTRLPRGLRASKISDRVLMPTMPRSSAAAAPDTVTYEQALAELEALVQAMEAGRMPLDQLLASYKRGAELLQLCRSRLQVVEEQVKLLEDGQLKPWTAA